MTIRAMWLPPGWQWTGEGPISEGVHWTVLHADDPAPVFIGDVRHDDVHSVRWDGTEWRPFSAALPECEWPCLEH